MTVILLHLKGDKLCPSTLCLVVYPSPHLSLWFLQVVPHSGTTSPHVTCWLTYFHSKLWLLCFQVTSFRKWWHFGLLFKGHKSLPQTKCAHAGRLRHYDWLSGRDPRISSSFQSQLNKGTCFSSSWVWIHNNLRPSPNDFYLWAANPLPPPVVTQKYTLLSRLFFVRPSSSPTLNILSPEVW